MKKLLMLVPLVAVMACSQPAENATETEAAPAEAAAPAAADSAVPAGDYDVKNADGTMEKTRLNADGTYVTTEPGGKEEKGKYARKDGKDCFDPDGEEPEVCWSAPPAAADGSFTSTSSTGETVTVTPAKK